LGSKGEIAPATDDIKERVLTYNIPTKCASKFHFLMNVRADQQGQLRWLRVWSNNAPAGYQAGLDQRYTNDFDAQRLAEQLQRFRDEEALKRSEEERKQQIAKSELERQQQIARLELERRQQNAARNTTVSNESAKCMNFLPGDECSWVHFTFSVTNDSREIITKIFYAWAYVTPGGGCPHLAAKYYQTMTVQPGETQWLSFDDHNGPVASRINYCLQVTGVDVMP
jgi:hypothetical protein